MLSWLSKIFSGKREPAPLGGAAENKYYIEKYNDFDRAIMTYYQARDINGKVVDINGIVNPRKIDNRHQCSVTAQQGTKPHCAAYSICNLCEALIWKKTGKLINIDADQVYARAKQIDGDISSDGTYLEAAIKAAFQLGGFNGSSIKIGTIYNDGSDNTIELVKFLLHKYDFLHMGFQITEGWYAASESDYFIRDRGANLGGHAVLGCGFDPDGVYIQNSWGTSWGAKGFGILPWSAFKKQFMYACYLQGSLDI